MVRARGFNLNPGHMYEGFSARDVEALFHDMPTVTLRSDAVVGRAASDIAVACGASKSNSEAKRLIKSGGLYVNNRRVETADWVVSGSTLIDGKLLVVRTGKKSHVVVKLI